MSNVKRSVKEITKDFVEGYKATKTSGANFGSFAGAATDIAEKALGGVKKVISGSLERTYTKKLWSNLGADAIDNYAVHHLLPVKGSGVEKLSVMQKAKQLGYDINNKNNLIALPRTAELAIKDGLPLHSGKHLAEYFNDVRKRVGKIDARYKKGLIKEENILDEIKNVENKVRKDLLDGKIRLQDNCPNFCGGK